MKYRKKPVVIEAIQWNGENTGKVFDFMESNTREIRYIKKSKHVHIPFIEIETLEGVMYASINDYIIKGISGEYYPCKPDIFDLTYEKVE